MRFRPTRHLLLRRSRLPATTCNLKYHLDETLQSPSDACRQVSRPIEGRSLHRQFQFGKQIQKVFVGGRGAAQGARIAMLPLARTSLT